MNLVLKPLFQLSWRNAVDSYNRCIRWQLKQHALLLALIMNYPDLISA